MKRFIDLKYSEALGLNKEIYKNSQRLKKDAEILVNADKSYATATSLLVLSLEELIKATIVLLHSRGYNVYKIKKMDLVFKSHEFRHGIAQFLITNVGLFRVIKDVQKRKKKPVFKKGGLKSKIENSLLTFFINAPKLYIVNKNVKNLEHFNDYKNNGFYVDYRGQIQMPVEEVDENVYTEVNNVYEILNNLYNDFLLLFNSEPKTEKELKEVERKKRDLALFIDEALDDLDLQKIKKEIKK